MFFTLLAIFFITCCGFMLTYFLSPSEKSFSWRVAAGNIVGATFFGFVAFLAGCAFGLSAATVVFSLVVALAPLILLTKSDLRKQVLGDLKFARENIDIKNALYYFAFLMLFYFFFTRAMIETAQGIFTGGSQNLGDLPFHLGAIFSFSDGQNLPPENPSFAFAKFTYPFMTDFLAACFIKLGAKTASALLWQNVTLALSLVVLLKKFTFDLTKNRLAGKLAPVIFLFCGGLGFVIFFRDYWNDGRPLFDFLLNLPADYTIREKGIRWGNSLTTLFLTQRGFLLGMPLTLLVLTGLWKIFTSNQEIKIAASEQNEEFIEKNKVSAEQPEKLEEFESNSAPKTQHSSLIAPILLGLVAGTLPLVHVHSLAVLFVVTAFLFFFRLDKWREWLAFGAGTALIAVPELLWSLTGSATRLTEFIGWNFGWSAGEEDIFIFWAKNLGLFLPLLLAGLFTIHYKSGKTNQQTGANLPEDESDAPDNSSSLRTNLLIFYLPFLLVFFIANLVKLAPWEWDNIKVLIYWFVASVPFVAWLLATAWEKKLIYKIAAVAGLAVLILSGALDVWRVSTRQINYQVCSRDSMNIAEQIKQKTAPNALFLNAPTYNSAVLLSGRRSLMRYSGHLASYGIDYQSRENEVKRIYEGSALAESLLSKNKIDYVIISPEERANVTVNEEFFSRYPVIAESGQSRVYQIKK